MEEIRMTETGNKELAAAIDGEVVVAGQAGFDDNRTIWNGRYVNLLGASEEDRIKAAYGVNYDRLVEIKKKWDPSNFFKGNYNISPDE
jgi:hypothetical protein